MERYHYTECGLSNIFLNNGFEVIEFEGEQAYSIHDAEGLHKAIGENILNKTTLLSGEEIRFLRKESELSQKDLASILGVSDQSVAHYEKSKTEQSQAVDIIIRMRYATMISVSKDICDYLERLTLDEIDRLEIDFSEENGHWASVAMAA
jgi:DNA-binding transcriptional regulator YiaG